MKQTDAYARAKNEMAAIGRDNYLWEWKAG